MPYEIRKQKNKFCVYNKDKNENKGCSSTYEKAVAHMRVLYGIEEGWEPKKSK